MSEQGQTPPQQSSAGYDWLEKTQTIAQMLYEEPSVGHIPLDLHSACAIGNYGCVQEAVNKQQDLSTRNKGQAEREKGWRERESGCELCVGRESMEEMVLVWC